MSRRLASASVASRRCLRALLVAGLAAVLATPSPARAAEPRALAYVDSSLGLEQPGLEAGDTEFEMGDVNGDGNIDLVSVGDHGNPNIGSNQEGILIWFGNGLGSWVHGHSGYLGYGGIALGDVDGDGTVDVAYGIHHDYSATDLGDQLLEVALGNGTGLSWTPWDDGLAQHGQDWGMFATDLGDVDGDGDLDVGSSSFGSGDGMHVHLNRRDGTWPRSFGFLGANSGHVFEFADIDGDGHLDIVTAKQEGAVWLGDGEGFFTVADGDLPPIGGSSWRFGPSAGDLDGDGRDDLAYCSDAGHAEVWLWRGNATWQGVSDAVPDTGTCQRTQIDDMDGDGHADVITYGDAMVHVFGNGGAGQSFTTIASITLTESPGTASAFRVGGDVDRNGRPDMVLVAEKRVGLFDTRNVAHVYRESSPASALGVRLVRPSPHRRWLAGSERAIDWISTVPPGTSGTITLELSAAGASGPWETIASGLVDDGRHPWIVPPRYGDDVHLRVTLDTGAANISAVSGPFSIAKRPDPLTLAFADRTTLSWQDALARPRFHLYRGDLETLRTTGDATQDPATVSGAARFCDLTQSSHVDVHVPPPGTAVFYLVTGYRMVEDGQTPGVAVAMTEGPLGQDSRARMRRHAHPCAD